MKFRCLCDNIIVDQSDALPYKAWLLPDQDWDTVAEEPDADQKSIYDLHRSMHAIYQCPACGRLTMDDPVTGETLWFAPESHGRTFALGSREGNSYKVTLRGHWRSQSGEGELFWRRGGEHEGGYEVNSDRDAFLQRYHEVFGTLVSEGRLREARLNEDGEISHQWPAP